MSNWWAAALEERLSQGDVFASLPFSALVYPRQPLTKEASKWNPEFYLPKEPDPAPQDGFFFFLGKGEMLPGIIVSHSCELDKDEKKGRVLVAPLRSIANIQSQHVQNVMTFRRKSSFPLPGIPKLGDYYADLRQVQNLDRRYLGLNQRLASMTPEAMDRFGLHVAGFVYRPPGA
jgi:hypothetical protein